VLRELAKQVAKAGVRAVDGRIIVDTTLFPDQSAQYGLGFVISPITVNDNAIDVTVTPGAKPGDPATIAVSPQTSYARFVDQVTTGAAKSDATVDFTKDVADGSGQRTVTMTGSQPAGSSALYA
jgi:D-alanyl-D-alanine carboxypeptidase/D-alanyl-D-alanine-endopeptidase (penicillin-binding protein 4)